MTRRGLPSNREAEESVLGAMLLSADATATCAQYLVGAAFWVPSHGHIFGAIIRLAEQGFKADVITVSEELNRAGLLEAVGGSAVLVDLQAGTPSISNVLHYAVIVLEKWEARKALLALEAASARVLDGQTPQEALAGLLDGLDGGGASTWADTDLSDLWASDAATFAPPVLGKREDGARIAAPGAVGMLIAAPESGKSMLALAWAIEACTDGRHVVYIDFESRATRVMARLRLHRRADVCRDLFAYKRPRLAMSSADRWAAKRMMATRSPQLVVIDGYNSLLAQHAKKSNDSDDVAALTELVIEPFTGPDTCTILIDHVDKDTIKSGKTPTVAIGSITKTGRVDWALAVAPNLDNRIRKGAIGESILSIAKDRDGELRHLGNRHNEFGRFTVNSDKDGRWNHFVRMPPDMTKPADNPRFSEVF